MEGELTNLLRLWNEGDGHAHDGLWPLVYDELRRLAGALMKNEQRGHTLQPTALVNEAYLKLIELNRIRFRDRAHFFAMASRMMRRILVDHARSRGARKRDGGERVTLDTVDINQHVPLVDLLDLDTALSALERMDPTKAQVVELRFFGGLRNKEMAGALGCSERTVRRHWSVAKLWLFRELSRDSKYEH